MPGFCESGIPDAVGMLCRFLPMHHGVVRSADCPGRGSGRERRDGWASVPGVFGSGSCRIAPVFLSGRPHWVYAQALLAVPMLRAPVSLLCSDEREQTEEKGVKHRKYGNKS